MIKILFLDVDGTLTDGKIYMSNQGETLKCFNVKDGLGIKKLLVNKIVPVIISGRKSEIVLKRASELQIREVYLGVDNKVIVLEKLLHKYHLDYSETAYIGDDENDIESMKLCNIKGCPADAHNNVKLVSNYICIKNGGEGAVREFIDYILE